MKRTIGTFAIFGIVSLFLISPAFAVEDTRVNMENEQSETTTTADEARENRLLNAKAKLTEAKKRICEQRQEKIKNRFTKMSRLGDGQIGVFNKISERVQQFYADKGLTVENYDALVAEVNAKKEAAQALVDSLTTTGDEFSCAGEDPNGMASQFKTQLQSQIAALKEYKTAIKNLIVAVKTAQAAATETDNQD